MGLDQDLIVYLRELIVQNRDLWVERGMDPLQATIVAGCTVLAAQVRRGVDGAGTSP